MGYFSKLISTNHLAKCSHVHNEVQRQDWWKQVDNMALEREFELLYTDEKKREIIAKRKSVKNRMGTLDYFRKCYWFPRCSKKQIEVKKRIELFNFISSFRSIEELLYILYTLYTPEL